MSTPTIERKVTDADMQRPVLCHLHPRYTGQVTPKVPCEKCWSWFIYKHLNLSMGTLEGIALLEQQAEVRTLAKRICTALLRGVR